jgi:4-amino-4-deoxy-L-arabinose transferase-like glycosyltransferase
MRPVSPDRGDRAVPLGLAALALLLHLPALARYGWFRDELYYVACSRHLAWGYVDHPPLSIGLLALWRFLFGDGLAVMRLAPALAHALTVLVVGRIARDLGGGRFAQALACLASALAPGLLGTASLYSMNALDLLFWTLTVWAFVRALERERPADWMALGLALGLGLLNKISVLWLGAGLFAGLLATPRRRWLATPWPWLAGALALALSVPHVAWQVEHGWPTLEFMRNAVLEKMVRTGPAEFLGTQALMLGLPGALLGLAGLAWCAFGRRGREWRVLAIAWLVVLAILLASPAARAGYLIASYGLLFATGGVALESLGRRAPRRWSRGAVLGLVALLDLPLLPFALPVLPVPVFVAYAGALPLRPAAEERTRPDELPQHYADMFGWEEMAGRVAGVYRALPAAERARCGVFARNYGEAGALDLFGPKYGLPPALSGHNSYWLWGPRGYTGEVMIVLGASREDLERDFASVTLADSVRCEHCMPYERGRRIWICRGLREPLRAAWAKVKTFI